MTPVSQPLYVSRAEKARATDILDILGVARARNPVLGIPEALVFTGSSFAQMLEGDAESVHLVMRSISANSRHAQVAMALERAADARQYGRWAMAFAEDSDLVEPVDALLTANPGKSRMAQLVARLMHARAGGAGV